MNDSNVEEYSFDEEQFLNVEENPTRNIVNNVKSNRSLQVHESLKSAINSHGKKQSQATNVGSFMDSKVDRGFFTSRQEQHGKSKSISNKNMLRKNDRKKSLRFRMDTDQDKPVLTYSDKFGVATETFNNDTSSFIAEDLDEGYAI